MTYTFGSAAADYAARHDIFTFGLCLLAVLACLLIGCKLADLHCKGPGVFRAFSDWRHTRRYNKFRRLSRKFQEALRGGDNPDSADYLRRCPWEWRSMLETSMAGTRKMHQRMVDELSWKIVGRSK